MLTSTAIALALQGPLPLAPLLPSTAAEERQSAFAAVASSGDRRYVPPLLDLLALAETREEWFLVLDALTPLTGRDMRRIERPWRTLSTELARGSAPAGRPEAWSFKGALLAERVDPAFARFFKGPPPLELRVDQVAHGGVQVAGIPALTDPAVQPAADATWLPGEAAVVGLHLGGKARAYPLAIIDWHEMVNDILGDVPVALTWCTLCGAAIPYRAERDGKRLIFGSSGLLHRSNKLMFDEGTDSLWTQLEARPVSGSLAGEPALEMLAGRVTTWEAWRSDHPDTTVLTRATGHERTYEEGAAYGAYFAAAPTMFAVAHDNKLGPPKEVMVVVQTDDGALAVDAQTIEESGGVARTLGSHTYLFTARPIRKRLPAPWANALAGAPATLDRLRTIANEARSSGAPLPPLSAKDILSLPRNTRRELLADPTDTIPLLERARPIAASRQLAADIVVHIADGRDITWQNDAWTDSSHRRYQLRAGQLIAADGSELKRAPSHLTFRFAAPSPPR